MSFFVISFGLLSCEASTTDIPTTGIAWVEPVDVGAPINGYPTWSGRQFGVYVNSLRTAGFERGELSYNPIMPLSWNSQLAESARYHSTDMAENDFYSHTSSDGTLVFDRINIFYSGTASSEEIFRYPVNNPYGYMQTLLAREDGLQDYLDILFADESQTLEFGVGFADGSDSSENWPAFCWTIDYGKPGTLLEPCPMVSGGHDFPEEGQTRFTLNYAGHMAPQRVDLYLEGVRCPVLPGTGSLPAGKTYTWELDSSATTRSYFFYAIDAEGSAWRYPGPGEFQTVGEGVDTTNYVN